MVGPANQLAHGGKVNTRPGTDAATIATVGSPGGANHILLVHSLRKCRRGERRFDNCRLVHGLIVIVIGVRVVSVVVIADVVAVAVGGGGGTFVVQIRASVPLVVIVTIIIIV